MRPQRLRRQTYDRDRYPALSVRNADGRGRDGDAHFDFGRHRHRRGRGRTTLPAVSPRASKREGGQCQCTIRAEHSTPTEERGTYGVDNVSIEVGPAVQTVVYSVAVGNTDVTTDGDPLPPVMTATLDDEPGVWWWKAQGQVSPVQERWRGQDVSTLTPSRVVVNGAHTACPVPLTAEAVEQI